MWVILNPNNKTSEENTTMNISDVLREAEELGAGPREASLKFALWVSALSTMQDLSKNARLAELLRPYVESPLPGQEELFTLLRKAKGILFGSHLKALYFIEYLDRTGQLDPFKHYPRGYVAQSQWRDKLVRLIKGNGISYKTASFAALIYAPMYSELVPVDRHVLRRLGYRGDSSPQRKREYISVEQEVLSERDNSSHAGLPLGLFHWFKWEEWRQHTGASKSTSCETHAGLSCRVY